MHIIASINAFVNPFHNFQHLKNCAVALTSKAILAVAEK